MSNAIKSATLQRLGRIYNRRCNQQLGLIGRRWALLAAIKREIIRRDGVAA